MALTRLVSVLLGLSAVTSHRYVMSRRLSFGMSWYRVNFIVSLPDSWNGLYPFASLPNSRAHACSHSIPSLLLRSSGYSARAPVSGLIALRANCRSESTSSSLWNHLRVSSSRTSSIDVLAVCVGCAFCAATRALRLCFWRAFFLFRRCCLLFNVVNVVGDSVVGVVTNVVVVGCAGGFADIACSG